MDVEKLVEHIENKLYKRFKDPLYECGEINNNMIVFNYTMYWDSYSSYNKRIQKETDFLLNFKDYLKSNNFVGSYFVGDYVVDIK